MEPSNQEERYCAEGPQSHRGEKLNLVIEVDESGDASAPKRSGSQDGGNRR